MEIAPKDPRSYHLLGAALIALGKLEEAGKKFEEALNDGKHVFIVDLDPDQEVELSQVVKSHPNLKDMGTEVGTPHFIFAVLHWLYAFIDRNLFSQDQLKQK